MRRVAVLRTGRYGYTMPAFLACEVTPGHVVSSNHQDVQEEAIGHPNVLKVLILHPWGLVYMIGFMQKLDLTKARDSYHYEAQFC